MEILAFSWILYCYVWLPEGVVVVLHMYSLIRWWWLHRICYITRHDIYIYIYIHIHIHKHRHIHIHTQLYIHCNKHMIWCLFDKDLQCKRHLPSVLFFRGGPHIATPRHPSRRCLYLSCCDKRAAVANIYGSRGPTGRWWRNFGELFNGW